MGVDHPGLMTRVVRPARQGDERAVQDLLRGAGLHPDFVAEEFHVLEHAGAVIGCARLRPLKDGSHELAGVAVQEAHRGKRLGADLVTRVLAKAPGPVYALALAPAFFAKLGFVPLAEVPPVLQERAATECASKTFVAMVLTKNRRAR